MFSLNGTLEKSGSVRRWEKKQFIGVALLVLKKSARIATEKSSLALDG